MKLLKTVCAVIPVMLITIIFSMCMTASAESAYTEWNGITKPQSNTQYSVSSDITVSNTFTIPKTSSITVRNGANLTIKSGTVVKCYGEIIVNSKSTITNKGRILLYSGGKLTVSGTLKQNGTLRTYNKSSVKLSGTLTSTGTSTTRFSGTASFEKSSLAKLYGNITLENNMTVAALSRLYIYSDNLSLEKGAELDVSGSIVFKSGSKSALDGDIKITDSGLITLYGSTVLSGNIDVEKGGSFIVREKLVAKSSSDIAVSGTLRVYSTADFTEYGDLSVRASGTACGTGRILCADYNRILCSGKLTVACNGIKTVDAGITSYGGLIIANKEYTLPSDYDPGVNDEAYAAYKAMKAAAAKAGHTSMYIVSGYRSFSYQRDVFNNWCSIYGVATASTLSAEPGHSEHQTGYAFDISSTKTTYGETAEGKWLAANCWKYGFIIRYAKDKTDITGYIYEPWHVRYVGVNAAKLIYNSGLCLEEFFGIA